VSAAPVLNIPLLDRLREAGGPIPPEALGPDAGAVLRDLRALEAFGFHLAWHPYRGVAYAGPADRLCPDQIEHDLGTARIGRRVAVWDRVASTNDVAARAAATPANEGLVVLAEEQTAGRGRRGRTWAAPPCRAILMSVVLRPPTALGDVAWLTALGALAVARVVESTARVDPPGVRLKWPNDVQLAGRKVAGVLVERRDGVVLGIGLNVNLEPADFPPEVRGLATSLAIETGRPQDRSELARRLIRALDELYAAALDGGPGALNDAWRARLGPLGQAVHLRTVAGSVAGRLVAADLVAGLVIEAPYPGAPPRSIALADVLDLDPAPSPRESV
jgi:BirA family biotin operon repressor/biotin-[acetyl-CoA-carboxylase] ligase